MFTVVSAVGANRVKSWGRVGGTLPLVPLIVPCSYLSSLLANSGALFQPSARGAISSTYASLIRHCYCHSTSIDDKSRFCTLSSWKDTAFDQSLRAALYLFVADVPTTVA